MNRNIDFKFNLGDEVYDFITGFKGIIIARTQWLHNCNTYGIKSRELKEGKPLDSLFFDEPGLELVQKEVRKPKQDTGGPERPVLQTNR